MSKQRRFAAAQAARSAKTKLQRRWAHAGIMTNLAGEWLDNTTNLLHSILKLAWTPGRESQITHLRTVNADGSFRWSRLINRSRYDPGRQNRRALQQQVVNRKVRDYSQVSTWYL